MAKGSCLCGAVSFEFDNADIVIANACFCTNCRKVSGSQYGTYFQVRPQSFRWLSGQDQIATFESTPGNNRGFCRKCGSVAPVATSSGVVRVPGGALDDDPDILPDVTLFNRSKARWCGVDAAQHHFLEYGPQEYWQKVVARLAET